MYMRKAADTTTPRARALASTIRRVREQAGVSGRDLCLRLGISHGTVSHWETGRRVPTPEDVAALLGVTGVTGDEKRRILELARNAADPNWLTFGMPGIPQQLAGVIESERTATAVVQWSPMFISGLLQTSDYAREIISAGDLANHEVEQRVMLRLGRREVLTRRKPVEFEALIGEAALRDVIGDRAIMGDQLRLLTELGARPNVVIRVMPARSGWHPGLSGPFVRYEFPDATPVMHFEHFSSGAFVPDDYDVQAYSTAIRTMRELAMSPQASAELIVRLAEEHENEYERTAAAGLESFQPQWSQR